MTWERIKKQWDADPEIQGILDEEFPYEETALAIIRLRLDQGWTQVKLAERVGTTQSAISRAESGSQPVSARLLRKIAAAANTRCRVVFEPLTVSNEALELGEVSYAPMGASVQHVLDTNVQPAGAAAESTVVLNSAAAGNVIVGHAAYYPTTDITFTLASDADHYFFSSGVSGSISISGLVSSDYFAQSNILIGHAGGYEPVVITNASRYAWIATASLPVRDQPVVDKTENRQPALALAS